MSSPHMKEKIREKIDNHMLGISEPDPVRKPGSGRLASVPTVEDAGLKLAETVLFEIQNSEGLSAHAKEVIGDYENIDVSPGSTYYYNDFRNEYIIRVYVRDDLSRPSLDPQRYPDGINDLILLLNDGVDHQMKPVFGIWHMDSADERPTWSRTVIPGAHFLEAAIDDCFGNYGHEYHIKDIKLNK